MLFIQNCAQIGLHIDDEEARDKEKQESMK